MLNSCKVLQRKMLTLEEEEIKKAKNTSAIKFQVFVNSRPNTFRERSY